MLAESRAHACCPCKAPEGNDASLFEPQVFQRMRQKGLPMVIDADGLYIVTKHLDLVRGYDKAILTPNKNEYARLASQLGVDIEQVTALSSAA